MKTSGIFHQQIRGPVAPQSVHMKSAWEWRGLEQPIFSKEETWRSTGCPRRLPCHDHKRWSPTSYLVGKWRWERYTYCPQALCFPPMGKERTLTSPHAQWDPEGPQTHKLEPKGSEFLKGISPFQFFKPPRLSLLANEDSAWGKISRDASHRLAIMWSSLVISCWHTGGTHRGRRWRPISRWARTWWLGLAQGSPRQHQSRQSRRSPGRLPGRWGCAIRSAGRESGRKTTAHKRLGHWSSRRGRGSTRGLRRDPA